MRTVYTEARRESGEKTGKKQKSRSAAAVVRALISYSVKVSTYVSGEET